MVDVATYHAMYGAKKAVRGQGTEGMVTNASSPNFRQWPTRIDKNEALPPDAELLLPETIYSFHLESKSWGKYNERIVLL